MDTLIAAREALGMDPHEFGVSLVLGLFVLMLAYYLAVEWLIRKMWD